MKDVKRERSLLFFLNNNSFCVPTPLFQLYKYKNRPLVFYSFIEGKSPQKPNRKQIKKIAYFLAKFHTISTKKGNFSNGIYTHENMQKMLFNTPFKFQKRYKLVQNIDIADDGLIHGDLFPDNSKFIEDDLNGVFDFIESCRGDFSFDLAVVANSWCSNIHDRDFLLEEYNKFAPKFIEKSSLLEMMKFSALFYALQRFNNRNKNYQEYLIKFDNLF